MATDISGYAIGSFFFSSLRARLILLVILAIVPVLGVTVYTAIEQRQLATVGVQETALRLARVASTQQGQMILGTRQLLIGLAQLREVKGRQSVACNSLFEDLLNAYPLYANLGAINRNGRLYCSGLPFSGSVELADRSYFQRAIQSRGFAIGDYQIGRVTKVASINFGYPIIDDQKKIQGVVFAALSLSWLNQVVREADLPPGSTFSVIDHNGKILIRYPDPEKWVGEDIPESLVVKSARMFHTGVAEAKGPDGVPRLIGFTPLLGRREAGDVFVSIGIPKHVAYADINQALFRNLTLIVFIAVIALGTAWFGGDFFILHRVHALVGVAQQLERGNLTARVPIPYGHGELGKLAQTFDEMAASLQKNAAQLQFQSTHDTLTSLANRHFFKDTLASAIQIAEAEHQSLALLLMDLDHFKEINDTIGHRNGDQLLVQAAQRLKNKVGRTGIVARLGGDEFTVLLANVGAAGAAQSAQTITKSFEDPFVLYDLPIAVGVSVGIALYPEHGADADSIIRHAEVAMYLAKDDKSGYAFYAPKKDRYSPERLTLLADLRRAIEENHLYLLYQPKIEIRTQSVTRVEALVRWQHPQLGTIPPDQFIDLAERTGLIRPLTTWVLNEALTQCQRWRQIGIDLKVAVNISARNLEADVPERISQLLQSHELTPQHLELEVTEGTIMKDPGQACEILTQLSDMGIMVSIDDFGTGYSSLSYLSRLPVDELKIDKSFVINMTTDENATAIVRSTIDLARQLRLRVVAEGVESQEVLDRLEAFGCDSAQGYYISRPINSIDLIDWLKRLKNRGGAFS